MFSELQPNCCWWKYTSFFTWQVENEAFKANFFINERHPNSPEHEDRSGWQRRKTWLQWLMWPSTQRIGKDIRASSFFFHWNGGPCSFRGLLHCDDRRSHDELVAMGYSMIAVALTLSWLEWILTVRPAWLLFHNSCFVLFCCWT